MIHRRTLLLAGTAAPLLPLLPMPAHAHHGWSSFDQSRPLWLEGRASQVAWRNPHAEVVLEVAPDAKLPADLAGRAVPAQSTPVDGKALLAAAQLPKRREKTWMVELAPLTRLQAWAVPEIKPGTTLAVLGFTFTGEKGDAVLRAEYLWLDGKTFGLRSAPV